MMDSGETAVLRQRRRGSRSSQAKGPNQDDSPESAACRTPTVQPAYVRGISQVKTEAQNAFMGVLCLFLFCHTQLSKVYTIQKESKITGG